MTVVDDIVDELRARCLIMAKRIGDLEAQLRDYHRVPGWCKSDGDVRAVLSGQESTGRRWPIYTNQGDK